jgi:hypothetical protein
MTLTWKEAACAILLLLSLLSRGFCATPQEQLNSARELVRQNQHAKALEILESLTRGGFANVNVLKTDKDLQPLQSDPRYARVLETAQRNLTPCRFSPEYRQFDFWVGDWNVTQAGRPAGTSSVQVILDDCVVLENWTGVNGYTGKSFNIYNTATKRWQQTWVDNSGTIIDFTGDYADGEMRFHSESIQADGSKLLGKMTFFKLADGKIRQLWEQSTDQGKTWSVAFDGLYEKKY